LDDSRSRLIGTNFETGSTDTMQVRLLYAAPAALHRNLAANVADGSFSTFSVAWSDVGYTPDCVAKLFSGVCANFSKGAGAFAGKPCRESLKQSDFQPASFVSSLQGNVLPKIHFDGKIAKSSRTLIFEFCNTIGQKQTPQPRLNAIRQESLHDALTPLPSGASGRYAAVVSKSGSDRRSGMILPKRSSSLARSALTGLLK
jgi:hypothetical protein